MLYNWQLGYCRIQLLSINTSFVKRSILILIACLAFFSLKSQDDKAAGKKVYKVNRSIEIPLSIGLHAFNIYGFTVIDNKPSLDSAKVLAVDKQDVWAFDRNALNRNIDKRHKGRKWSDWGLNFSVVLPALLMIDKDIRQSWVDIGILYAETHGFNTNLYVLGGPFISNRKRPFVYYDEVPFWEKLEPGTTDSFFSGHTSTAATSSFFMAKVYSDYHPELGGKKWWLFAAALLPPAFVGYNRIRALKHFPTDVLTGTAIGAAVGVLNPHLHKIDRNNKLSFKPISGNYTGLALVFKL